MTDTPADQDPTDRSIRAAREKCHLLYAGERTPHRSCGIAMAETFGRRSEPYQALRKGGITGFGPCGVVLGAKLILGEILGDPDPTGPTTPALKAAVEELEARLPERVRRATCNELTAPFDDFAGPARHAHCTRLAGETAALLQEVLLRNGVR